MNLTYIPFSNFFLLTSVLFVVGFSGVFLHRRNIIIILIAVEIMLLAVNFSFISISVYLDDLAGQIFSFYILTVAAGESALGLALLVSFFNVRNSISIIYMNRLQR